MPLPSRDELKRNLLECHCIGRCFLFYWWVYTFWAISHSQATDMLYLPLQQCCNIDAAGVRLWSVGLLCWLGLFHLTTICDIQPPSILSLTFLFIDLFASVSRMTFLAPLKQHDHVIAKHPSSLISDWGKKMPNYENKIRRLYRTILGRLYRTILSNEIIM